MTEPCGVLPLPTRLEAPTQTVLSALLTQEGATGRPCPIAPFRLSLPTGQDRNRLGNLLAAGLVEATQGGYRIVLRGVLILADSELAAGWIARCNAAIEILSALYRERQDGRATIEDLLGQARISDASRDDIARTLTHLNDIGLLGGSSRDAETGYVTAFSTVERIIDVGPIASMLESREIYRDAFEHQPEAREEGQQMTPPSKEKVFIIHGRNVPARNAVEQFVRSLGLEPIDFDELAGRMGASFIGEIVAEGMRRAQGIIAIFTADEVAFLRPGLQAERDRDEDRSRWQSRPNVIFEAGMAYGSARERTILAVLGDNTKLFSDLDGLHLTYLANSPDARQRLRQKLIGAGCSVNTQSSVWTDPERSGDFDACSDAESSAAVRSPFDARDGEGVPAPSNAPEPSESDARIRLRGWLNNLPIRMSGSALNLGDIAREAAVGEGQVKALLPTVVSATGSGWSIDELGDRTVILNYTKSQPPSRGRGRLDFRGF